MRIQQYLLDAAARYPEKMAVVELRRRAAYRETLRGAETVAAWLASEGVGPGDRVGLFLDGPIEYVMAYFGVLMSGAAVIAFDTQTTARMLRGLASHSQLSTLITQAKHLEILRGVPGGDLRAQDLRVPGLPPEALSLCGLRLLDSGGRLLNQKGSARLKSECRDVAQIIYTSGTTGRPKGVMLRHENLDANTRSIMQYLSIAPDERPMVVLPFFYSFGNSILLTHVAAGATLMVHQSLMYPKIVLDMMRSEAATSLSGVPSTFAILASSPLARGVKLPHLRYLAQAGGPMAPRLAGAVKDAFPGAALYIMYGQTEASARLSYLPPGDFLRKPGSIGRAVPGVALHLLDRRGRPVPAGVTGEIVASGPNIMKGYWRDKAGTAKVLRKEGLWTGDLAKQDDEGYFYIVGRRREMIKSGAHRIGPREIEEILLEHPAVKEAAVFGVEDEILGEAAAACVVKKANASLSPMRLLSHCRKSLPAFKMPKHVWFVASLPKTASGKIRKAELKIKMAGRLNKR